ncbi:MAG: hypothetical protein ACJ8MR_11545 [Povalibacter sp.]
MKMETPDSPEKVAHFYRQALTRYGTVLECSGHAKQHASARESNSKDDALECDSEDQDAHELVYKVGTQGDQRIVAIKPHNAGARFSLVRVDVRGDSKE